MGIFAREPWVAYPLKKPPPYEPYSGSGSRALLRKASSAGKAPQGQGFSRTMSRTIQVGLLSGRSVSLEVGPDEPLEALQSRAQKALAVGRGRLLDSAGGILDGTTTLEESGLQNGDMLTLQLCRVQVCSNTVAFAAILGNVPVVTWGGAEVSDYSSLVQELKDVQQIQATGLAFAAILGGGSVATWGHAGLGGDSSAVHAQLKDVQQIQANSNACAAILGNGSVVTWGEADSGGDSGAVQEQLQDVQLVQASIAAFAAILGDGSVVTWGSSDYGGDSRAVQHQLKDVQQIQATGGAFAAILGDGSVVTWGHPVFGGDSSAVQLSSRVSTLYTIWATRTPCRTESVHHLYTLNPKP